MRPLHPDKRRLKYAKIGNHVGMIDDPDAWIIDGILPLTNSVGVAEDEYPRLGVLVVEGYPGVSLWDSPYTVYETSMHDVDFENCPRHRYASAQEVLDAGWEVD